jgi:hypothetical protein
MNMLAVLRRNPSSRRWELTIRQLLLGKYEGYLSEIGGIEEFVRIAVAESRDPARAEEAFRTALDRIISAWEPAVPAPEVQFERHIELIAAFLPAAGFHRLLAQLEGSGFFPTLPNRSLDVDRMGLLAMGHYFPRHPFVDQSNTRTFKAYEKFLRASLAHPNFAAHACRRLLELTLLSPESAEVRDLVRDQAAQVLPELFRLIFLSQHSIRQALLSILFADALIFERADLFGEALKEFDARVIYGERPAIQFRKKEIQLHLPDTTVPFYVGYALQKEEDRGRTRLEELLSEPSQPSPSYSVQA